MRTPWIINKLSKWQLKVMCKCSYVVKEDEPNKRRDRVLPPSASTSRGTTSTNPISSPSSSTSQRKVSTSFISSPRSQSSQQSQVLEARSTASIARDEAKSSGSTPRIVHPKLKTGKLKRRVTIGSSQSNSSGSIDEVDEANWPPFADEDYIVFCFEEDGEFHVVMDESPRTISRKLKCEDHGNVTCACTDENKDINNHLGPMSPTSRRDCLLPNKERKEEEISSIQSSPKLNQDRIEDSDLLTIDKIVSRKESTESLECRNGSVESTDSSRLDWEEHLHEINPEDCHSSSPRNSSGEDDYENSAAPGFRTDCLLPNKLVDEEEIFSSPKSERGMMITIEDLWGNENDDSSTGTDESCGSSGSASKADHDDQLEHNEEPGSLSPESTVSSRSKSSSSSFEFPVLEWECISSPVTWPRSGRLHFKKQNSQQKLRRPCLKCCRF